MNRAHTSQIPSRRYGQLLATYLRPQRATVALLGVVIVVHIGLQLANPQIIRAFIDAAVAGAGDTSHSLLVAALTYLGFAIAGQALSTAAIYVSETVAWTATNAMRRDLTAHCLQLDMSFHKAHTPGALVERIDGDVTMLSNFFSQMAIRLLSNGLLALGILIALFYEDWRIGLVGVGYVCLMATAVRAVQKKVVSAWAASRQAASELFGFMGERLYATEDIRANGGEPHVMARLFSLMRTVFYAWRKAQLASGISRAAGGVAYLLTQLATLAIGVTLFSRGQMTIGAVYLLLHYLGLLRAPLVEIRQHLGDLQRASASIERIETLFRIQSSVIERPRARLPEGPLRITFDGVTFQYQDGQQQGGQQQHEQQQDEQQQDEQQQHEQQRDEPGEEDRGSVLDDISFVLEPGKVLGLLGRTGSGKTTLTRLLFRLYDPVAGAIRLGDVPLEDVRLSDIRQRVGLVTQDVQLFRGTVRDNVRLFDARVSDPQILDAFRELGLWEWFRSLPDGLDTALLSGSKSLSAGEAQLLAFTRIYLKDPGVVILDEASSRLDPATEQLLERAVDRLLHAPRRTAIVIAHRLLTVGRADEIMVLKDGRIDEHGAREALAGDPSSHFYRLLQTGLGEVLA
jgi:ATP-binding cassette, subfamily B, bacterial